MRNSFRTLAALTVAIFVVGIGLAEAGQRHQGGGGSAAVGRAVPRGGGGGGGYPGGGGGRPPSGGYPGGGHYYGGYYYRPYYGYYGYYGYPYGYYPYGWGFSVGLGWGYPYGYVGGAWGYPYGPYGYAYPYVSNYGGVKIEGAPKDAAVYADGYYVGTVDDFDGTLQKLNLESGAHHIEIARPDGAPNLAVDVNIRPGQTVTFRAN